MTILAASQPEGATSAASAGSSRQKFQHELPLLSQHPTPFSSSSSPSDDGSPSSSVSVLVVGGGPAGIVTLRNLREDETAKGGLQGFDAVMYERQAEVGGVWHLDDETVKEETRRGNLSGDDVWPVVSPDKAPDFPSPAYPALDGNVIPEFVSFSGKPFPPVEGDTFPTLDETSKYLLSVAEPLRRHIKTRREVRQVWELPSLPPVVSNAHINGHAHPNGHTHGHSTSSTALLSRSGGWLVHTLDHSTVPATPLYEHFSALCLSPGFTTHPYYPNIPGLGPAMEALPRKIHHAKYYRTPEPFWRSKRVVVVGNGNSSNDIASHIAKERRKAWGEGMREGEEPIRRCIRHEPLLMFPSLEDPRILDSPHIVSISMTPSTSSSSGGVQHSLDLTLASGEVLPDVDHLIFGTGYQESVYDWVYALGREHDADDVSALEQLGITLDDRKGWTVHAEKLVSLTKTDSLSSTFAQHPGLQSLWLPLTPPARYPSTNPTLSPSSLTLPPPRDVLTGSTDPLDLAYPNRIPHLYCSTLNARNPTLAFINILLTGTPFVLADLTSRLARAAWEGPLNSCTTTSDPTKDRAERHPLDLSSQDFDTRRSSELTRWGQVCSLVSSASSSTPGPNSSTPLPNWPPFAIPGQYEFTLYLSLYSLLTSSKPFLSTTVTGLTKREWTDKREEKRWEMYREKRRWLERRRKEEEEEGKEGEKRKGEVRGKVVGLSE